MSEVLWATPIAQPFTIILREKYGPAIEIDNVNLVIEKDGKYYISRGGRLYGQYPLANYSVTRKSE